MHACGPLSQCGRPHLPAPAASACASAYVSTPVGASFEAVNLLWAAGVAAAACLSYAPPPLVDVRVRACPAARPHLGGHLGG